MLARNAFTTAGPGGDTVLEYAETVLPALARWTAAGMKTALVSLTGIDGAAPRPVGAQMAVAEDGRAVGYISGGCVEGALIAEAQAAMAEGRNRLVRYGAGSPYIDVRLPCGSGLDIYVDQELPRLHANDMAVRYQARQPFRLETELSAGTSLLHAVEAGMHPPAIGMDRRIFNRIYWPQLRLVLTGAGPAVPILAALAADAGWQVDVHTPQVLPPRLYTTDDVTVRRLHTNRQADAIAAAEGPAADGLLLYWRRGQPPRAYTASRQAA
jgi:xanthine dehydrogenase accessory factor